MNTITTRLKAFSTILFLLCFLATHGQTLIPLYDGAAPGSEDWDWEEAYVDGIVNDAILYNVVHPELQYFPAPKEKANGTAVIIAPGGAFHILSMQKEGTKVAEWLNTLGVAAFVLKYRVVKSETDDPFEELRPLMADFEKLDAINAPVVKMCTQDGIQAMDYVRSHAEAMNIDPQRIGLMGFSAGATLTMSVLLSAPQALKPNFAAPIYAYGPAIIGTQMPEKSTPLFVGVASDDQLGFVPHSIALYEKWQAAQFPAELHIYEKGGHGFGMAVQQTSSDHWIKDFENWLFRRTLIGQQ